MKRSRSTSPLSTRLYASGEATPADDRARGLCPHPGTRRAAGLDHAGRGGHGSRQGARRAARAALRHPLRGEGQYRRRRAADHLRLSGVRLCRGALGDGGRALEASGRHPDRQDQSRSVRDRPERHALALRHPGQRLQPRLHFRRLELGLGGRGRRGPRFLRARHRYGRIGPRAGRLQQYRRAEADQGPHQHARRGARLPDAGRRLDPGADGRRCRQGRGVESPSTRRIAYARRDAPPFAVEASPEAAQGRRARTAPISFFGDADYEALYYGGHRPAGGARRRDRHHRLCARSRGGGDALCRALGRRAPRGDRRLAPRETPRRSTPPCAASCSARATRPRSQTFQAFYDLAELIAAARREWAKIDVLLLPTAGTTYKIAEMLADPIALNTSLGAYTNFVNLMDLAALAVPAGFRARRHSLRRDADRAGVLRRHARLDRRCSASLACRRARSAPRGPPCHRRRRCAPRRKPDETVSGRRGRRASCRAAAQWPARRAQRPSSSRRRVPPPGYRLYALAGTSPPKPGLVFDGAGSGGIEVEIWEMDAAAFGSFVALIPPPLGIGTVTLADGAKREGLPLRGARRRAAPRTSPPLAAGAPGSPAHRTRERATSLGCALEASHHDHRQ